MSAAHRLVAAGAWLCVVAGVLLLPVASPAAITHDRLFQFGEIPAEGPLHEAVALPGGLARVESMTVDSGHVWIAEQARDEDRGVVGSRVDEFDAASGAFIAQPVHGEPLNYGEGGIAVAHGPGEPVVYVGGIVDDRPAVSLFSEAGTPLGTPWTGASTPAGSFGVVEAHYSLSLAVAVDNSTDPLDGGRGDVYVAYGSVIDVFHPEVDGEEHYIGSIEGVSLGEAFAPARIAVDERNGDLVVLNELDGSEKPEVDVFEPVALGEYRFVRRITGPPPSGFLGGGPHLLAVDSGSGVGEGEIYVAETVSEPSETVVSQFSTTGVYRGHIAAGLNGTYSLAVDPASHDVYVSTTPVGNETVPSAVHVFGPDVVTPDVTTGPVANLKPHSATLTGAVDPDGAGAATCKFVWGTSPEFGHTAACAAPVAEGESPVPVQVTLSGLEPDTTYYYRLQASDAGGLNPGESWQDMQFTTPGARIEEESVVDVTATSAELNATIDPDGAPASYYFQYGTSAEYGDEVPAQPGAVGSGKGGVEVPAEVLQELSAGTLYHYRVVAVGEVAPGEVETLYGQDCTFVTQTVGDAFELPDGREWELVSPPDKRGALIEPLEDERGVVQAAGAGDAITYIASAPVEAEPQGYPQQVSVLSTRGVGGWSSKVIAAPRDVGAFRQAQPEDRLFSEDLSLAVDQPASTSFTPLSPLASETTAYLRTDYLNGNVEEPCRSACFTPLVTAANTVGVAFGEESNGVCEARQCGPHVEGASPDLSHLVIGSRAQLTSTPAPAGGEGLYEWSDGHLRLIDQLPTGEEGAADLAGVFDGRGGGRGAVSGDGGRVVMEGFDNEKFGGEEFGRGLYLHDLASGETIRLDVAESGGSGSVEPRFMIASSDASRVFFLDSGHLTAESSVGGPDLYEYDLQAPPGSRLRDLTVDRNAGEAADVVQVLGSSEDGSYMYFAAVGVLADGARAGCCNIYVYHEGTTRLVAALPGSDTYDWSGGLEELFARVSPDGRWLAFMSEAELTGYDTHDALSGHADAEVYLYDADTGKLVCASCDQTGARPVGFEYRDGELGKVVIPVGRFPSERWVAANVPPWTGIQGFGNDNGKNLHQARYLSDSGRLFFDSDDALVPQDVNGTEDVYEYEPAGVGSCSAGSVGFSERSGGCVSLISSGTSPEESGFLDASETGGDVFFLTEAQLVPQDLDTAFDVYDAHECTAVAPCHPPSVVSAPPCVTGESCKAPPPPQPAVFGPPPSATFTGAGNPPSPQAPPQSKTKAKTAPRSLTRARRLARALRACRGRGRRQRVACERVARGRYEAVGKPAVGKPGKVSARRRS